MSHLKAYRVPSRASLLLWRWSPRTTGCELFVFKFLFQAGKLHIRCAFARAHQRCSPYQSCQLVNGKSSFSMMFSGSYGVFVIPQPWLNAERIMLSSIPSFFISSTPLTQCSSIKLEVDIMQHSNSTPIINIIDVVPLRKPSHNIGYRLTMKQMKRLLLYFPSISCA